MRRSRRSLLFALSAVAVAALMTWLAACAPSPTEEPPADKVSTAERLAQDLAPPGIYDLPAERAQIIGTLEGESVRGPWRIAPRMPSMSGDAPGVAISNPEDLTQPPLSDLAGAYVVAEGTLNETVDGSPPSLEADSISRIQDVRSESGGKGLSGVPFRWARVEKPGTQTMPNSDLRGVGTLSYADSTDNSKPGSWVLLNEMPFGGGRPASTSLVLSEGPFGDPMTSDWEGAYVEVFGDIVGAKKVGPNSVPVMRVSEADRVTTMVPTTSEVFH